MKLPRFKLRTLLLIILVAALALEAWLWISWPTRTLSRLDELLKEGRTDAAQALIVFEPDYRLSPEDVAHILRQSHTPPVTRSLSDIFMARRTYKPLSDGVAAWVQTGTGFDHMMIDSVTIERGTIRWQWGCTLKEWNAKGH